MKIRGWMAGFEKLSAKYGVKTVVHNHSGKSMGLNSCAIMNVVKGFDPAHIGGLFRSGAFVDLRRAYRDGTWTSCATTLGAGI